MNWRIKNMISVVLLGGLVFGNACGTEERTGFLTEGGTNAPLVQQDQPQQERSEKQSIKPLKTETTSSFLSPGTIVTLAYPAFVVTAVAAPLLAYYSGTPGIDLASALVNTAVCVALPFANTAVSCYMEEKSGGGGGFIRGGKTMGVAPVVSFLRNTVSFCLNVGSMATAWKYYSGGNETYQTINTTLTTVSAGLTLGGTTLMYGILYPDFIRHQNKLKK